MVGLALAFGAGVVVGAGGGYLALVVYFARAAQKAGW